MILALLGEHREVVTNAFLKTIPSSAIRSMLGVFKKGYREYLPKVFHSWSSVRIKTILGLELCFLFFWAKRMRGKIKMPSTNKAKFLFIFINFLFVKKDQLNTSNL